MNTATEQIRDYAPGERLPTGVIPIPLVGGAFMIDNSSTEKIMTCHRAAEYYISRKRELNKPRSALEFGKIIHRALETRYREAGTHFDADALYKSLATLRAGFDSWSPDDPEEFRNYDTGIKVLSKYHDDFQFEDFEVYRFPDGQPAVEFPFAIPFGTVTLSHPGAWVRDESGRVYFDPNLQEIPVVIKGKIDLIYRREGGLYGLDHKTTSMMGPQYFTEFELSSQVHTYSWAIERLTGQLPSGYTINGLGIRKPTKTGKSLEFIRHTIPVFPGLVREWEQDTLHILGQFLEQCVTGYTPKMTKWCVAKYGICEYKGVCGLPDPDHRLLALYSNEYRDVTWDPLKE
jgi:hypothetical protein